MTENTLAENLTAHDGGAGRFLHLLPRILGGLALLVLVADGVLSVAMGSNWLEWQRDNTPPWYARLPAALLRLPDPALRAIGAVQAAASAAGVWRLGR